MQHSPPIVKPELTKREIRLLLRAIDGPSCVSPKLAAIYEKLQKMLRYDEDERNASYEPFPEQ